MPKTRVSTCLTKEELDKLDLKRGKTSRYKILHDITVRECSDIDGKLALKTVKEPPFVIPLKTAAKEPKTVDDDPFIFP